MARGGKTSGPPRRKVRHSGEQSLCHITIAWEWVKQGADRQGSVGILTRAKKDRDEQPGGEEWRSKPWVWGWRLTASHWLYPTWERHTLIELVAIPADLLAFIGTQEELHHAVCIFDLIIGPAVLFL